MMHSAGRTSKTLRDYSGQDGTQFKTLELFLPGISHLIFLDCGLLQVSETAESKAVDKGATLYFTSP